MVLSASSFRLTVCRLPSVLIVFDVCFCLKLCYIRCTECKHDVDLCANCFFRGQEPGEHKKTHSYRVMDKLDKPIYSGTSSYMLMYVLSYLQRMFPLRRWVVFINPPAPSYIVE